MVCFVYNMRFAYADTAYRESDPRAIRQIDGYPRPSFLDAAGIVVSMARMDADAQDGTRIFPTLQL